MIKTFCIAMSVLGLAACASSQQPSAVAGLPAGTAITIINTIQKTAPVTEMGTGGKEIPIEQLIGQPAGSLTAKAKLQLDQTEVKGFLGLWDVDVTPRGLSFSNIVTPDKQPFPGFLRVIEAGTFDRYYISMDAPFCRAPKVDKAHVQVECLSEKQLKLTIGAGYDNRQAGLTVSF